jgi:hypothetical protein
MRVRLETADDLIPRASSRKRARTQFANFWRKSAFPWFRRLLILRYVTLWFLLVPKITIRVKVYLFQTSESVQKTVTEAIKTLIEADFQSCYEAWKIRWHYLRWLANILHSFYSTEFPVMNVSCRWQGAPHFRNDLYFSNMPVLLYEYHAFRQELFFHFPISSTWNPNLYIYFP